MFVVQAMCHLPAMAMWDRTAFEHLKYAIYIFTLFYDSFSTIVFDTSE